MNVEFAAYGERNGAHALHAATFDNLAVEKTLQITDLAWGLPDHSGETPMYRGRPIGDYYVLVKTVRDAKASRPGMAASVAAFFPLDEVIHESNFKTLIEVLPLPAHNLPSLTSRILPRSSEGESLPDAPGLRGLMSDLLTQEISGPVVWVGIDSFINVTSALWARLPPYLRRSFAFAFVCDPSDGNRRDCCVIYCPDELSGRWNGKLVTKDSPQSSEAASTAERFFFDDSIRQEVDGMIEGLAATIASFADLRRAFQCHDTLRDLRSASHLDATKLIRNIAILSPVKELGWSIKQLVIEDICRRIESEGATVIGLIRNIDFDVFGGSRNITTACSIGIRRHLLNTSVNVTQIAELIQQATKNTDRGWAIGVIRGVTMFAQSGNLQAASRIWQLLEEQPSLAVYPDILLPNYPKTDLNIAAAAPAMIDRQLADSLREAAISQGFPELHAVTLASLSSVKEAAKSICDMWSADDRLAALRRLCKTVAVGDFLECVEHTEEDEFIEVVAEVCVNEPTLLNNAFSGTCRSWRLVLCRIVELSPATIDNVVDLDVEIAGSIQLLLEDGLEMQYQLSLSKTKYANLLASENRSQLWCRLASEALPEFLNATAHAWIDQVHRGLSPSDEVEPELRDAILSNDLRDMVLPTDGDGAIEKSVNAFDALPRLQESDFEQWRQSFLSKNRNLSTVDAILLGQFVQRRGWKGVAARLADDVNWYKRSDLRPAVGQFLNMLSWIARWHFGDSDLRVPPDEWWREFETTLIGLYSDGPSSTGVWERAGGDPADLLTDGTGANQWRYCLQEVHRGFQSGELSIRSLVEAVSADYANNSTVKVLKETCPR